MYLKEVAAAIGILELKPEQKEAIYYSAHDHDNVARSDVEVVVGFHLCTPTFVSGRAI